MAFASANEIRLDGRTAIVTGAARGLGRAMATALAKAGANVVFADIDGAGAETAADAVAGGNRCVAATCDITSKEQCFHVVRDTVRAYGDLHILVNNAAKGPVHVENAAHTKSMKFYEADPDAWQEVIRTNVNGTYLMSCYAAPYLIEAGWGRIINITTSLSTMQRGENSPYGVSKTAIEAETLIWAQDLAGTGVTVNSLIPGGAADTDFVSAPTRAKMAAAGRRLIQPDIMIDPLLWLCSAESDGITAARYVGRLWDSSLPPTQAAAAALEAPVLRHPSSERR